MLQHYKTGLQQPRPGSVAIRFSAAFDAAALPTPPKTFGRSGLVKDYGMLGNDRYGCCVPAGHDHIVKLRNKVVGVDVGFTEIDTLDDYTGMTGFQTWNPLSDQGTDMQAGAAYWQKTGMRDDTGATGASRHCIDAYVDIKIGDIDELLLVSWLCVGAGMGVNLPGSAESQFDAGQPWDIVDGDSDDGGHFIPIIDRAANGNLICVTWGREQEMTIAWARKYMNFGIGYLSKDIISKTTNLSPNNFNYTLLDQYLLECRS